jgi:hypothetical protein
MTTIRELKIKVRSLEAENKKLRKALKPIVEGTYWITGAQVKKAREALGLPEDRE